MATHGTVTPAVRKQSSATLREHLKRLKRHKGEWYERVAAQNRAAEEQREARQK